MVMVDSVSATGLSALQQLNFVSGLVRVVALGRVSPPTGWMKLAVKLLKHQFSGVAGTRFVRGSLETAEIQVTSAVNASDSI